VKNGFAFCSNITSGGTTWEGGTANYEIMVPTNNGVAATETYYFFADLR
jgi:hypothetical protein